MPGKPGFFMSKSKYRRVVIGGETVYKHRHIAGEARGKKLLPDEEVHHIDENKENNALDNLMVMRSKSDHNALHKGRKPVFDEEHLHWYCPDMGLKSVKYCPDCAAPCVGERCLACSSKAARKVSRPDKVFLIECLKKESFAAVGRRFGVSDNCIRKWCRSYDISDRRVFWRVVDG